MVGKYFSKWKKGEVPKHEYPLPAAPAKRIVAIVDRPTSVQSVVDVSYPVELKPGSPDAIKVRIMNEILGGSATSRLFTNLREKHAYTYGAYSSLSSDKLVGKFSASSKVRNEVTDSAVAELIKEISSISKEKARPEELQSAKNYLTGNFARSLENPQTVANFAISTARYGLPKDYYTNYLKTLNAVTIDDVSAVGQKYLKPENMYIVVVGKGDDISKKLERFGEEKFYDIYGNAIEASSKVVPTDVTVEKVYSNYIKAVGGAENIKKVKDVTSKINVSVQGMTLEMVKYDKAPNKTYMVATAGGNEAFKMVFDGTKGYQSQMGQKQEYSGTELADVKIDATLNYELYAKELGLKTKLMEMTKVNGKDAYKIEMTPPGGSTVVQYFDKETGLKVKEDKTTSSPQGSFTQSTSFSDYRAVNGVKFPFKFSQSNPNFNMDFQIQSLEINKGVKDDFFVVK